MGIAGMRRILASQFKAAHQPQLREECHLSLQHHLHLVKPGIKLSQSLKSEAYSASELQPPGKGLSA